MATRRISELLDLLATAEFYRGRTLDRARYAIEWNTYYTTNPTTTPLINAKLEFLQNLESEMADLRLVYITILTMSCHLVSIPFFSYFIQLHPVVRICTIYGQQTLLP